MQQRVIREFGAPATPDSITFYPGYARFKIAWDAATTLFQFDQLLFYITSHAGRCHANQSSVSRILGRLPG